MKKPILVYFDFNKIFKLYIDISNIGLEIILMQKDNQKRDQIIYYEAKTLLSIEKNYPITKKDAYDNVGNRNHILLFKGVVFA